MGRAACLVWVAAAVGIGGCTGALSGGVMTVMAGGLAGAFRTGRYIKYAESGPNPRGDKGSGEELALGPAYNKLYVSIMQAMGVERDAIGQTSAPALGFGSGTIDLTGPLPGLR